MLPRIIQSVNFYFMQKLAEFVNVPSRKILLLTTLHQNFNAYSRKLNEVQKEEWTKVKGVSRSWFS